MLSAARTLLAAALAVTATVTVTALDNGFAKPAMGFNPWNCFGVGRTGHKKFDVPWAHGFNDTVIRSVADAMASTGLRDAGYEYVNLDCGWTTGYRDGVTGAQIVNKTRYPFGIKSLADYIHGKGMKFGIYSSASTSQCCSKFYKDANDGSLDHEAADARAYVSFGVDYLKFDGCNQEQRAYPAMRDALNASGRHVVISVNGFNMTDVAHAGNFANSWRTTGDDDHQFLTSLAPRAFLNNEYAAVARPGQYNDADMLEVGNMIEVEPHGLVEARSHFALWTAMKSPLLIGTDVTNMTGDTLAVLTNPGAIAVNQDPLGLQAFVVWASDENCTACAKAKSPAAAGAGAGAAAGGGGGGGGPKFPRVPLQSVWAGPLAGGGFVAVLLNLADAPAKVELTRAMLQASTAHGGAPPAAILAMRDVWTNKSLGNLDAGSDGSFVGTVEPHGVIYMTLRP